MRHISQCFDRQLTVISQKIANLNALNKSIRKFLPDSLKTSCTVVAFKNGSLSIAIDNVHLAAELRYFLPELRDLLRKQADFRNLIALSICICPENCTLPKKIQADHVLSKMERSIIAAAASQCENYQPLKDAWTRLANDC